MQVFGGTILLQGTIIFKVQKLSEEATFNQIMKMVENAQNSKAPIQAFADKLSSYFVPTIVILAVLDWIFWFTLVYVDDERNYLEDTNHTSRFQFAFDFGISTLVIACPCALGLATPTAVMVGTGLAASYGILIKGADILEKITKINTIVFDKTGTLTEGKPQVKDLINCNDKFKLEKASPDNEFLYQLLYLTECTSEHPIAQAICKQIKLNIPGKVPYLSEEFKVKSFQNRNGEGVIAEILQLSTEKTMKVLCGNLKLMNSQNVFSQEFLDQNSQSEELKKNIGYLEQEGKTVVILVVEQIPSLVVSLEEAHLSKPESKYVVNFLKSMGM